MSSAFQLVFLFAITAQSIFPSNAANNNTKSQLDIDPVNRHLLKFLKSGQNPNQVTPQFTSTTPDYIRRSVQTQLKLKSTACSIGMWALYNSENFGEGSEESTAVISIKSTDINRCTSYGTAVASNKQSKAFGSLISTIKSVNYLGSADYSQDGVSIYSDRGFLGGSLKTNPNGEYERPAYISGFPLRSIAITGPGAWRFCSTISCTESGQSVCVDNSLNEGNMYLNQDTQNDSSVQWPRVIRDIQRISPEDCALDNNPAVQISSPGNNGGMVISISQP